MWGDNWESFVWTLADAVRIPLPGWAILVLGLLIGGVLVKRRGWTGQVAALALVALLVPMVAMTAVTPLPYTFTNGTPADANQVNENFTALAARIDALEAQLAGANAPSVAGRSYNLTIMSWALQRYDSSASDAGTNSEGFWNSEVGREVFRATFSAAGTEASQTVALELSEGTFGDLWADGGLYIENSAPETLQAYWRLVGRNVEIAVTPGGPALFSMMATPGGLLVGSGAVASRNEFVAEANEYKDEVETVYVFAVEVPAQMAQ